MEFELSQILVDIVKRLQSGSINPYRTKEKELTNLIKKSLIDKGKTIGGNIFYAGQEKWEQPSKLSYNNYFANPEYALFECGFNVDIVVNETDRNVLIENKKIFKSSHSNYSYIYQGNLEASNQWGHAPIFENNNEFFFTYFHEGQIWLDIIRLLNFGCTYDRRFMIGFIFCEQQTNQNTIRDRLQQIVLYLQKQFHNPQFADGCMRVFSQLNNSQRDPVFCFLAPKNKHTFWVKWCNDNDFVKGVYSSQNTSKIFSYLFEIYA